MTNVDVNAIFPQLSTVLAAIVIQEEARAAAEARKLQEHNDQKYTENLKFAAKLISGIGGDPAKLTRAGAVNVTYVTPEFEIGFTDFHYNSLSAHKNSVNLRIALKHALTSEDVDLVRTSPIYSQLDTRDWHWSTDSVVTAAKKYVTAAQFPLVLSYMVKNAQSVIANVPKAIDAYKRKQAELEAARQQAEIERAANEAKALVERCAALRERITEFLAVLVDLGVDTAEYAARLAALTDGSKETCTQLEDLLTTVGIKEDNARDEKRARERAAEQQQRDEAIAALLGCAPDLVRYIREIVRDEIASRYEYE